MLGGDGEADVDVWAGYIMARSSSLRLAGWLLLLGRGTGTGWGRGKRFGVRMRRGAVLEGWNAGFLGVQRGRRRGWVHCLLT